MPTLSLEPASKLAGDMDKPSTSFVMPAETSLGGSSSFTPESAHGVSLVTQMVAVLVCVPSALPTALTKSTGENNTFDRFLLPVGLAKSVSIV